MYTEEFLLLLMGSLSSERSHKQSWKVHQQYHHHRVLCFVKDLAKNRSGAMRSDVSYNGKDIMLRSCLLSSSLFAIFRRFSLTIVNILMILIELFTFK